MIQLKGRAILNTSKFLISVHISGTLNLTKLLIQHGANVNVADDNGVAPLHVAAAHSNFKNSCFDFNSFRQILILVRFSFT